MKPRILLDTGPLVAFLHAGDTYHEWAREQFSQLEAPLLTCEAVIAESCHLLRRIPNAPHRVLELIQRGSIEIALSLQQENAAITSLLRRYDDRPASLADICLVRLSEIHDPSIVLTLDSDFYVYRRLGRKTIPVLHPDQT
ncbi:PIN domain-containing protein [Wenzhouxiangella sp. AB-CW3]|uniref:type II toxin-antitoxin system VapC family toxin n=1 Tax=Wenzhouxiangella sp. AB-CW3 TaxID=2771012 RepID=UPI00168B7330|nr:PIN domain-containing protein [Wenzhouxiangella sp. AB-CW3]QOC23893.1 PIN domain-containing protein [Wenzhouxiangella sp. AB-CW3]